jgi:basic membrane lipoprotein Med (substrate-binding protein (PBP1-ABC) superfamily)
MKIKLTLLVLFIAVCAAINAAQCEKSITVADLNTPSTTTLKAMFVYSNDINDFGYVFAYEQARVAVERKLTGAPYNYALKTSFWVNNNVSTVVNEMVPFINDGYTLFLFNGGQFTPAVNQLASSNPTLKFLGTSSVPNLDNTAMVMSRNYEWYFLNGVVCGMVTKTNKVAYLTFIRDHPDPYLNANAFWHGATLVNPDAQVHVASSNSYSDDVIGQYAIDEFAKSGVDCFAINQNTQTANARASSKKLISCGTSSDSRFSAGEYVFTSGIRFWDDTIFNFVKQVLDNNWQPKQIISDGFNQSALTLAWWSTLATEPQYDLMRQTVETHMNSLIGTSNETLFCGELATLTGYPKNSSSDCMTRLEILSTRRLVPGIILGPFYTRASVTSLVYVKPSDGAAIAVICIVAVFCVFIVATLVHLNLYRNNATYKASSPLFMMLILVGMLFVIISCIFWSLKPTKATCALRSWIAGFGWILITSALLAKTHRIYEIFDLRDFKAEAITNTMQIIKIMIGMLAGEFAILVIWQALDPLVPVTKVVDGLEYNELYQYCKSKSAVPISVFLAFNALALIPNMLVAWITRTVTERYNESSAVGLTSAVTVFIGIIVIGATKIVNNSILAAYILPTIGMLGIIAIMYVMIFIPKILYVHGLWDDTFSASRGDSRGGSHSLQNTGTSLKMSGTKKSQTKSVSV